MSKMSLRVNGADDLARKLTAVNIIQGELTDAANKANAALHQRLSTYPPQRPRAKYRRTRRLGNSWAMSVEAYGGGVKSTLKNPVEYGGYVMDPTEQAQIHQGAWATTRKVLEEQRQKIVGFFTAARDRIVQRLNA